MSTVDQDVDKEAVWSAYRSGSPVRVPCTLIGNARIFIQDPEQNTEGMTFEQAATIPEAHVTSQLKYQLYRRTVLNHYSDDPVGLPERWTINLDVYNVYEAAIFGAEIDYSSGQVPDTIVPYPDEDSMEAVFDVDITRPLENPFIAYYLDFWREMEKICKDLTFEGRPVDLAPWMLGSDGPVTVACNLRGTDFLMDLVAEPEYADRLMNYIMDAALNRRKAFYDYWGEERLGVWNGMADDSIAMLSSEMVLERVVPILKRFYGSLDASKAPKTIHLCGDSTRHFPMLVKELGISSFDTGFPVDHGKLRRELGPDVEIMGGPQVALLSGNNANAVYERTKEILLGGVKEGGRFILRDGNNLPPCCPLDNLAAMYEACKEFGSYE